MSQAKQGDTVKIEFTGTTGDGQVFASSQESGPAEFVIGSGTVLSGLEEAVVGMAEGDTRSTTLPSDKAFGEPKEELIVTIERSRLPEDMTPQPGQAVQFQSPTGEPIVARISSVTDENVTLDANHPLAGEDVSFDIKLVEISK